MYINKNGELQETNVYIVYGAPASGKTTYVQEHMNPGDLVVDLDEIRSALTMSGKHSCTDSLLPVMLGVRDWIYNQIEHCNIQCENIWVVAMLPHYEDLCRLQERFCAGTIYISTPKEECLRRMMNDLSRPDKEYQRKIIEKYFSDMD